MGRFHEVYEHRRNDPFDVRGAFDFESANAISDMMCANGKSKNINKGHFH
jgi:hypothetical protein